MNLTPEQHDELRKSLNSAFRKVGEAVERDNGPSIVSRYFFAQAHVDYEAATRLERLYNAAIFGALSAQRVAACRQLARVLDKIEQMIGGVL